MAVSINGTTLTFNDATTMTTAATGTVSSVATGNGLSGGTITTTGTLVVACPTFNTVGSYVFVGVVHPGGTGSTSVTSGTNYSAGSGKGQFCSSGTNPVGAGPATNNLSGSWKWMGGNLTMGGTGSCCPTYVGNGIACRVS